MSSNRRQKPFAKLRSECHIYPWKNSADGLKPICVDLRHCIGVDDEVAIVRVRDLVEGGIGIAGDQVEVRAGSGAEDAVSGTPWVA